MDLDGYDGEVGGMSAARMHRRHLLGCTLALLAIIPTAGAAEPNCVTREQLIAELGRAMIRAARAGGEVSIDLSRIARLSTAELLAEVKRLGPNEKLCPEELER